MFQFIIHYQTDEGDKEFYYSDCFNTWDELKRGMLLFDYSIVGTEENVNMIRFIEI